MTNAAVDLLLDTLRLRGGLSDVEVQARWNATELRDLARLVVFEGADVWLSRRLRQRGVLVPAAFREQLKAAVRETAVLNMRIDAQAVAVISRLTAAAIPYALIKGQARRAAASLYPFADARPVSDVDLLLPESQADEAWTLLCRNGFRRIYDDTDEWSADHHRPVLIDDSGVAVELHTTTSMSVSPAEAWRRATDNADVVLWTGVPTSVPSPPHDERPHYARQSHAHKYDQAAESAAAPESCAPDDHAASRILHEHQAHAADRQCDDPNR